MPQELRHTTSAPRAGGWAELTAALGSLPTIETVMACIVLIAFALPIFTFLPPLDMNGVNRAANQLSRKVVSGQDQTAMLARSLVLKRHTVGQT